MATAKKSSGRDIDDVPTNSRENRLKPGDIVDLSKLQDGKWKRFRLIGEVFMYGGHWVTTKKRDGSKAQFWTPCAAFDREHGVKDQTKKCAWCDHEGEEVRFTTDYYMNAIDRSLQKAAPERPGKPTKEELASGFKDKESDSWTPVVAHRASTSQIREFKGLKGLNTHENAEGVTQAYGIFHPRYGRDVSIKLNASAAPAQRYSVQAGDHSPLTKEERSYLTWDLSNLQAETTPEEVSKEYESWYKRFYGEEAGKKKKRAVEEDHDDEDSGFDDEDDAPPPKKKPAAKKKVVDEDDEDDAPPPKKSATKKKVVDEDDEDDWDDEEDEPAPKKKPAAKKKVVDEDDEDDEDDAPPPKKKPAAKKSKPSEDEEDEDWDEDEDDAPPPKKSKPAAKKKVVEEDEDEDEDDEDDAPPKKKPAAKKAPAKKKVVDEDDDEDWDE